MTGAHKQNTAFPLSQERCSEKAKDRLPHQPSGNTCGAQEGLVANHPEASFWLPVADGRFYPDFVAEPQDGRRLALE